LIKINKNYKSFLTESLNEAKKTMSKTLGMDSVPEVVIEASNKAKKEKQFENFVNNLPGGESTTVMIQLFNEMAAKPQYLSEFISKLSTVKDPNKIDPSMYSTSGSFGQYIFNQKPVGVGRGELFMAWIMADSKIQRVVATIAKVCVLQNLSNLVVWSRKAGIHLTSDGSAGTGRPFGELKQGFGVCGCCCASLLISFSSFLVIFFLCYPCVVMSDDCLTQA
jgi:hypothetical protein